MKDVNLLIYAAINGVAVMMASYGIVYGLYVVMALLSISTFNIVVGSAAALNFIVDLEEIKNQYDMMEKPSLSIIFMVQILYIVSIITMYKFGFVLISGIFIPVIAIGIVGTILKAMQNSEKSEKN